MSFLIGYIQDFWGHKMIAKVFIHRQFLVFTFQLKPYRTIVVYESYRAFLVYFGAFLVIMELDNFIHFH